MKTKMSLPLDQFPRKFQLAIKQLETPRRGRRRYSPSSITSTVYAFGHYLAVVQQAGLPLELSHDGLSMFIDELDARTLRNSTRLSYLAGVQVVAKEVKYPSSKRRLILEDCEIYREGMKREVPKKVRKLAANPITLRDIANAAVKWREQARQANERNKRRTYYIRSAILALLSLTPIRIKDVAGLVVGQSITRDEIGWVLSVPSSKTGFRHNGRLHKTLTPYLDDLILFGEGGPVQHQYVLRAGTPLFANETNDRITLQALRYNFKLGTNGHTPHIVRTLVHDAMAEHGVYGTELAMVLCGQNSLATVKHYEINAASSRTQAAQNVLLKIQEKIIHPLVFAT